MIIIILCQCFFFIEIILKMMINGLPLMDAFHINIYFMSVTIPLEAYILFIE